MGEHKPKQVFINCPFDNQYRALLRPILFTVCYLGLIPRIASETLDSATNRIDKICDLIRSTEYSIHDMSRCICSQVGEFYRMNMPFEFGVDYGFRFFTRVNKRMLVLVANRYDYQKALSDISGVDAKAHHNEPEDVVGCVRNWAIEANIILEADSPTRIWYRFMDFASVFYDNRKRNGFSDKDLNDMPTNEYIKEITTWLGRT